MPMKMYKKSTNAWPSVKSRKYAGATSFNNKDEEEVLKIATKTDDKSTNAWPVQSKTYAGTTGTSSSNEDEKRPYISERKSERYFDHISKNQ